VSTLKRSGRWRLGTVVLLLALAGCDRGGGPDVTAPGATPARPGQLTYQRFCFSCHSSGISGAPPAHDAEAWRPRVAQGDALLLKHTIDGMPGNGMPPRGMCVQCTDQQLLDAIHFMAGPTPSP
jgi:cytochrome c5